MMGRPLAPALGRIAESRLLALSRYSVGNELALTTGGLLRFEPRLMECPSAVNSTLRMLRQGLPAQAQRHDTTIEDVYLQAGAQLLILGDPGAGKTMLLLELARRMMFVPGELAGRIPVVFHLRSWAEGHRTLQHWLVHELHRSYGVAQRLGRVWVAQERIVPLLDGLDEVEGGRGGACVEAINAFRQDHGRLPMVVSCRIAEYEAMGARLKLGRAVRIEPLTSVQAERYLAAAGEMIGSETRASVESPPTVSGPSRNVAYRVRLASTAWVLKCAATILPANERQPWWRQQYNTMAEAGSLECAAHMLEVVMTLPQTAWVFWNERRRESAR